MTVCKLAIYRVAKMTYKPLYSNVLIRVIEEDGIITPDEFTDAPLRGEVVATGDGEVRVNPNTNTNPQENVLPAGWVPFWVFEPLPVNEGDVVLFFKRDSRPTKIGGEQYYLLNVREILLKEQNG